MKNTEAEFKPYISANTKSVEFTPRAAVLGVILALVFGAANAYLGLKVGLTVSASIPAAVISMALLRGVMRKGTVLENNIVQTIGSSGESLSAGVIFTIPAFLLLGFHPTISEIFVISLLGGMLGIFFMIPLRRYLIVKEHKTLPFPEGTACAEVLIAGDTGGSRAKTVGLGLITGGLFKFFAGGLKLWKDEAIFTSILPGKHGLIGLEPSAALLGVGYIIGTNISCMMFAGGMLGWLVMIPLIGTFLPEKSASDIASGYLKYIGAGAVATGGIVSLIKAMPVILNSFKLGLTELFKSRKLEEDRTSKDISMRVVLLGAVISSLAIFAYLQMMRPNLVVNLLTSVLTIIFGFFFVTVASRIVGIVGSSSCPVSGMTITTILFTGLVFVALGWRGEQALIATISVGAVVCIAICMSSDASQDLKTGYLVGATPYKQQIAEFVGVFFPATIVGLIVYLLDNAYGIGKEGGLQAPQATLMSMISRGVVEGNIPKDLILMGMACGLVIELLGIASLPFAIGLYLPISLSTPIIIGGLLYWMMNSKKADTSEVAESKSGILMSSGLIAGEALVGILLTIFVSCKIDKKIELHSFLGLFHKGNITDDAKSLFTLVAFLAPLLVLWWSARKNK